MKVFELHNGMLAASLGEMGNEAHRLIAYRVIKEIDPEYDNACGRILNRLNKDMEKQGYTNRGVYYITGTQCVLFVRDGFFSRFKRIPYKKVDSKNIVY